MNTDVRDNCGRYHGIDPDDVPTNDAQAYVEWWDGILETREMTCELARQLFAGAIKSGQRISDLTLLIQSHPNARTSMGLKGWKELEQRIRGNNKLIDSCNNGTLGQQFSEMNLNPDDEEDMDTFFSRVLI